MIEDTKLFFRVFRRAASAVPAYKRFLKRRQVNPSSMKTASDIQSVPVTDKHSYIHRYPFRELFPHGTVPPMGYMSSGSSGAPTFWFRGDVQEGQGGSMHETMFREIFHIKKSESTLAVICFSMGVWIAGNYSLAACRYLARRGYRLTALSPGIEMEDIMHILKNLAPEFENLVVFGYPPFVMDVFNEASRRGVRMHNKRICVVTAGDKFSEEWRDDLTDRLPRGDAYRTAVGIYGSADAGAMGHETPLSIYVRRKAMADKDLFRELFGDVQVLPGLVQYHPARICFEETGGELLLTADTAIPLVRYNIHDAGRVVPFSDMMALLKKHRLDSRARSKDVRAWRKPFLILNGRTDVAVTFYAINIFPEHIRAGLEDARVARLLSGNFSAYNKTIYRSRIQKLYFAIELAKGVKAGRKVAGAVGESVVQNLIRLSTEFRKLYSAIHERALPVIRLLPYGERRFLPRDTKGVLNIKGKKPKMITSPLA